MERAAGSGAIRVVYWAGLAAFALATIGGMAHVVLQQQSLPSITSDPTLRSSEAMLQGEIDVAARELRAFEAIVPRGNPSILEQARLLASLGRRDEAFATYERAAHTLTHSAQAQSLYGAELFARRRFEEAAERFERVLAINPNHPNARENLAVAFLNSGKPADAIDHYEQVLENGESAQVHDMLSRAHEMLGSRGKTLFHAERALQLEPENSGASLTSRHALRGACRAGRGRPR